MNLKAVLRVLVLLPGLSLSTAALAQSAQQVLDTIVTYGAQQVYEMDLVDGPPAAVPLDAPVDSDLRACKLTANRGLFCINAAKQVVNWINPDSDADGVPLFSCTDIGEFDAKSSETCTAITLDPAGNIWLAGKNKGRTHSLVKVEQCPADTEGDYGTFCSAILWATGRPLLLDIEYIGGEAADAFTYGSGAAKRILGAGILGLQERKTVVFFPTGPTYSPVLEPAQITEIGSGKSGWGLSGNEQLQGVTLLQPTGIDDDFVLVTTSTGRIIAMNTATLTSHIAGRQVPCDPRSTQFGIRASAKTGRVYATSKDCSNFTSYEPTVSGSGSATSVSLGAPTVVALSTPPEGPTIAPGIGVDLNGCKGQAGCPVTLGATLFIGNSLASDESGLIVFQVKDIPDCRWINPDICDVTGAIVNPGGSPGSFDGSNEVASLQYLNVTPLLPSEITDLFTGDDELPPLLISPQYRGQDGWFEAFFYVTEEGVRFSGTFDAEYEVADLAGDSLGCRNPDSPDGIYPSETPVDVLLKWDVATRVSENYISVGGPGGGYDHVDTLINTGCGSLVTKKPGFSLVPYNLEITPHTYYGTAELFENNDAVFARLLEKLFDDLREVIATRACYVNVDTDNSGDNAPLSDGDCDALLAAYDDSILKLDRCIEATYQPKTSAGAQNCQSFVSQFKKFTDLLAWVAPNGPDPANRIGEIEARVATILHVYETRFIPSVPDGGFCVETDSCATP